MIYEQYIQLTESVWIHPTLALPLPLGATTVATALTIRATGLAARATALPAAARQCCKLRAR